MTKRTTECLFGNTHHAPLAPGVRAPAYARCQHCGRTVFVRGIEPDLSTPEKRRWWAAIRRIARRAPRLRIIGLLALALVGAGCEGARPGLRVSYLGRSCPPGGTVLVAVFPEGEAAAIPRDGFAFVPRGEAAWVAPADVDLDGEVVLVGGFVPAPVDCVRPAPRAAGDPVVLPPPRG